MDWEIDEEWLKERVRQRLAALNRSPLRAAKIGGLARDYIRDWLEGRKVSVKREKLPKVAKGLDWTLRELMGDTGKEYHNSIASSSSDTVQLPEFELRAGVAYAGGFGSEENTTDEYGHTISRDAIRAEWTVPLPFLRDEMHVRMGRAHILPVRGDSMMDALYDGDRAIIDLDDTDVSQGGIFALVDDNGSVIIKQVELVRGEKPLRIRCTSRNEHYKPFDLMLEHPVKIVGRVACKITRL